MRRIFGLTAENAEIAEAGRYGFFGVGFASSAGRLFLREISHLRDITPSTEFRVRACEVSARTASLFTARIVSERT
jgi:hypothetical protein